MLVLFGAGAALLSKSAVAQPTINFSESTNLKAVYDAGLRPWRIRPDESSSLNVTDQTIRVITPSNGQFIFNVEIASFGILTDNQLGSVDFISQPMSLAQAADVLRQVCHALNIDMTTGAGMEGFEEKLSQMSQFGNQMPAPQYWNGRGMAGEARTSATLRPLFGIRGISEPRGKVIATIIFYEPGMPLRLLTEPVKQPPGYEHISMEKPETNPERPFPDPAYRFERMDEQIADTKVADKQAPRTELIPNIDSQRQLPTEEVRSNSLPWSWIIGAILVMVVLGGVLISIQRR